MDWTLVIACVALLVSVVSLVLSLQLAWEDRPQPLDGP